jgi:succinoglycan biosynthesis transport protein ExoP
VEIFEYLNPLRRWWWLVILGTLVAVSASYVALLRQPPVYQARTAMMIGRTMTDPNPNYADIYMIEQLANTYADLASRAPVRKATMESLGIGWLPAYNVQLVPNTQLLEITVSATDPSLAQAAADALAQAMVAQSPTGSNSEVQQRQGFVTQQLDELEAAIQETRDEITKTQAGLAGMLSAREIADAQAQIAALQSKLRDLQSNYAVLLSNTDQGAANTLTVVEPAELPTSPTGGGKMRTLLLVAMIGFILSAGTAYLLSYLDDTLKTPADVKRALGLTTLAGVPVVQDLSPGQELLMLSGNHSAASEAYRVLRTNLQFTAVDHPLRTLLVTSPAPSEGKSLTTANLAVALAQAGLSVVVLDTDLHRPRLHKLFGVPSSTGLTSALLEEHPVTAGVLRPTSDPRLRVLPSGPTPPNPTELLGSERMRELISSLAEEADILLLDSPPVLILADAAVLSTMVDGVLLVIDAGRTRRDAAAKAVESLRAVNARLVGAVINRMPTRGAGSYYYYHYYKDYGYGQDGKGQRSGLLGRLGIGKGRRKTRREGEGSRLKVEG